jgi:hypothetical protein
MSLDNLRRRAAAKRLAVEKRSRLLIRQLLCKAPSLISRQTGGVRCGAAATNQRECDGNQVSRVHPVLPATAMRTLPGALPDRLAARDARLLTLRIHPVKDPTLNQRYKRLAAANLDFQISYLNRKTSRGMTVRIEGAL